jgi:hypothetical protein
MNLVGDPWYSDGLRAVMFLEPRPLTLSEVEILDWERPSGFRTVAKEPVVERGRNGQP